MALIDYTYFKGIISIDISRADVKEKILEYSDYCEEKYLKLLMGTTEYYAYKADPSASKYVSLFKASTFIYSGETYYKDIKNMLAHFVYFELANDQNSFNSVMGEMSSTIENASRSFSRDKLVRAYNKAVDMYNDMYLYLDDNSTDFPDLDNTTLDHITL